MLVFVILLTWNPLLQAAVQVPSGTVSAELLRNVSDDFFAWKLREFPRYATYQDVHDYDDTVEQCTLDAFTKRKDDCVAFLERLNEIDEEELFPFERQNLACLRSDLSTFVDGYEWRLYGSLNPLNFLEGTHRLPTWLNSMRYKTYDHYELYLTRLRAYVEQLEQVIELMTLAIDLNRTNHIVSMKKVTDDINDILSKDVSDSDFFGPFNDNHARELIRNFDETGIDQARWSDLKERGYAHVQNRVYPALTRLYNFLVEEYLPNTRQGYGVGSLDGGLEYYEACLRFHLSTNLTAQQVRDIGLKEVERIKVLMEDIMRQRNFKGTLQDFFEHLRTKDRKLYYNRTAEQLLEGYVHIVHDVIKPKLRKVIRTIPPDPLRVSRMMSDGPSGSYTSGTFYVNLNRAWDRPTFTMMALALHEGNPGHHLQRALGKSLDEELPAFRRNVWSTKYYASPFNFPWYTAYTEGWGLYAEYLGEEMGCYNESALELFGRYSSEIFRACRLVVDTGIHAFNWSRQEAIDYLHQHTAIPISQIETEVDRYITWPGQACAYKIGEIEILRMRKKATDTLGGRFDVREFNDQVLKTGSVPMYVLENEIDTWIEHQLATSSSYSAHRHLAECQHRALLAVCIFYCIQRHLLRR